MKWISLLVFVALHAGICLAQSGRVTEDDLSPRPKVTDILTPPPTAVVKVEWADDTQAIQFDIIIVQVGNDYVRYVGEEASIKQDIEQLAQEVRSLRVTKSQQDDAAAAVSRAARDPSSIGSRPATAPEDRAKDDAATMSEIARNPSAMALKTMARKSTANEELSELISRKQGMALMSRPRIITHAGEAAVAVMGLQAELPYMERVDADTFKLRHTEKKQLGINLSINPAEPKQITGENGAQKRVSLANIKLSLNALDGRAPLEGVDLPIGMPIVSTRSIETAIELQEGEPAIIELPVAAGKHVYMFVTMLLPK